MCQPGRDLGRRAMSVPDPCRQAAEADIAACLLPASTYAGTAELMKKRSLGRVFCRALAEWCAAADPVLHENA